MQRIQLSDFLLIAEIHSGMDAHQLGRMPRVVNLAEAALAAPFAGFKGHRAFPSLHQKAAIYCSRIVTYHPLPNGNKRTAYDVMREFLDRNGATFTHPSDGLDGTAQAIEALAAGGLDETGFITWVHSRVRSRTRSRR